MIKQLTSSMLISFLFRFLAIVVLLFLVVVVGAHSVLGLRGILVVCVGVIFGRFRRGLVLDHGWGVGDLRGVGDLHLSLYYNFLFDGCDHHLLLNSMLGHTLGQELTLQSRGYFGLFFSL